MNKYYIVGTVQHIKQIFPDYQRNDERYSNDGRMLIEVELTEMKAAELLTDEEIGIYNHEQVIELLNSEPEKWGGKVEDSKEYTREDLESMRKSTLVEIAEGKKINTSEMTKADIVEALLSNG